MFYPKETHPGVGRLFEALEKSYGGIVKYLEGLTDAQIEAVNAGGVSKLQKDDGKALYHALYHLELPLPKNSLSKGKTHITLDRNTEKWTLKVVDVYMDPSQNTEHTIERMTASVDRGHFQMTQRKEQLDYSCEAFERHVQAGVKVDINVTNWVTNDSTADNISDLDSMITDLKQQLKRFVAGIGIKRGILLPDVQKSFAEKRPGIVPNPSGR